MKKSIENLIKKMGYEVTRYPGPNPNLKRRLKVIKKFEIDTILDVGANDGLYSKEIRNFGYSGKIISFEPLRSAFKELEKASLLDENWLVYNHAIGNQEGSININVAGNSESSSILNMLPQHELNAPKSKYIGKEEVQIWKLDSIYRTLCKPTDKVMLKVDTQGYERKVLEGSQKSLKEIRIIQLEMSIVPLYENETVFMDMLKLMKGYNFQLFSLENGFSNGITGQLLQVDGIFVNNKLL